MEKTAVKYNDFWFKIIGSVGASAFIDALNREESIIDRLSTGYFYTDLFGGFVIALALWEIIRFVTIRLDKRFDWFERPGQRITLQFAFGVLLPALTSFLLTAAFMKMAYNQDIFQTAWLYNEFYSVILIILLINLTYFTWWLYLRRQPSYQQGAISDVPPRGAGSTAVLRNETLEVSKAGKTILLPFADIAYSYLSEGYCYIRPFQGESFVTTYTLDEVSRLAGEENFFRVNRQVLVSRRSCTAYKSIENGKIELEIHPAFKTPVIVSQKRASDFRKWISLTDKG